MAYAAVTQKKKPSFYVAKSWHNRFAGKSGENIRNACNQFKVQIKLAPRESSDTGVYVTGHPNSIEKTRKYFEKLLGFAIGIKPLMVCKCKIVPIEVDLLTNDRNKYISMVKKYGVAVAFPKKNNNDSLTLIQGRDVDINGVMIDFGKILKREIKVVKDNDDDHKTNESNKRSNKLRRLNKSMSRLNMEINEVLFFHPAEYDDDHDFERFIEVLTYAEHSIDICVFTITDNRIRYTLADEARSGTKIRLITDNSQAESLGSDARWLNEKCNIPVKVDWDPNEQSHMHHKFCIIDNKIVMTGSFNWTRSASDRNYENILITTNKSVVKQFGNYFKNMWKNDKTIVDISIYQYQSKQ